MVSLSNWLQFKKEISYFVTFKRKRESLSQWNLIARCSLVLYCPCKTLKSHKISFVVCILNSLHLFVARDFHIWSRPLYVWLGLASLHPGKRCLIWANLLRLPPVYFASLRNRERGSVLPQRGEILWASLKICTKRIIIGKNLHYSSRKENFYILDNIWAILYIVQSTNK